MTGVLIDTSTFISLALASRDNAIPSGDTRQFWRYHGGLGGGIDALILNETILIDEPSVERNMPDLPELTAFTNIGEPVSDITESAVYAAIGDKYVSHVEDTPDAVDLFRMHTNEWIAAEVGATNYYPSAGWRDIESELDEPAKAIAVALRNRFAAHTPYSGAACALLLRTLYYDWLQQATGSDLVLHPLKTMYREATQHHGASVISVFDDGVRKAFYSRKSRWLGRDDLTVEVPVLTQYVLGKCHAWSDLADVVLDIRSSKPATKFREGMVELTTALRKRDNIQVDQILGALDAKKEEWRRQIGSGGLTKKISFSVPLVDIGMELEVPDKKLTVSTADKITGFVHLLLAKT